MSLRQEWEHWLVGRGEDPSREGLAETPGRVCGVLDELVAAGDARPADFLQKTFAATGYDDWVRLDHIPFGSLCEHHLLPFHGEMAVAYWPTGGRVVGLSKLVRLVDLLSRRLSLQERFTVEVAEAIFANLRARAVAVRVEAEHQCMALRGVRVAGLRTTTWHRCGDAPRWPHL
jgi:GTP cyclohydrolase I